MKLINREGIPSLDSYIELIKEEIIVFSLRKCVLSFSRRFLKMKIN